MMTLPLRDETSKRKKPVMTRQENVRTCVVHAQNRIVLLGASNLTLSLRLAIQLMQRRVGSPSEILTAVGHGRAYGVSSQVMWRGLPGIAACGLWQQLDSMPQRPTVAMLTDIGNDILYGLPPEQILHSVEWCIGQLQHHAAQIVVTNLPIASIEGLSERRYTFFRTMFYSSSQMSRAQTVDCARAVHQGLTEMASRRHFKLYEQKPIWFGLDGIHIDYLQRQAFYQDIVQHFPQACAPSDSGINQGMITLSWQRRPVFAYKTFLNRSIHCQQPSGQLTDGSTVCKY